MILGFFFFPVTDTSLDIVEATYGCVALSTGEEHMNIFKQRRKCIFQHSALKSNFFVEENTGFRETNQFHMLNPLENLLKTLKHRFHQRKPQSLSDLKALCQ